MMDGYEMTEDQLAPTKNKMPAKRALWVTVTLISIAVPALFGWVISREPILSRIIRQRSTKMDENGQYAAPEGLRD